MAKPAMYEWPHSQKCMECEHGQFVCSDTLVNSDYLCMVGCNKNDGVNCPKFSQSEEESEGQEEKK